MLISIIFLIIAVIFTVLNIFAHPILKKIYGKDKNIFTLTTVIKVILLIISCACCILAVTLLN